MPTCCVPGCDSGYNHQTGAVSFHRFPSDVAESLLWTRKIHREDYTPNEHSRVCSKHFALSDYCTQRCDSNPRRDRGLLQRKRLKKGVYPTIFPNLPSYLTSASTTSVERSTSKSTASARIDNENDRIQTAIDDFFESDRISSLVDLNNKFNDCMTKPKGFHQLCEENFTLYFSIQHEPVPIIDCSVKIYSDLSFEAHQNGIYCNDSLSSSMEYYRSVRTFSDFLNLLSSLRGTLVDVNQQFVRISNMINDCIINNNMDEEHTDTLQFLSDQMSLCSQKTKAHKFQVDTLVKSIIWHNHSSSCYLSLKDAGLILPSIRTIQRITSKFQTDTSERMESYLIQRRASLNDYESVVSLIFDEVYVYQHLDYSNGKFVGLTDDGQPASTVLTFMIKSLSSKFCDVISFTPLRGATADILFEKYRYIMEMCHRAGFFVLVIIADNHPANRKLMTSFICDGELESTVTHPIDNSKRLHLLIDPTHNFKNLYNNFQRNEVVQFAVDQKASFNHIKALYDMESGIHLRMAHRLFPSVISPTSTQRTSVKLACAVFHESTASALEFYASTERSEWTGTAKFVRLICDLWKIINVKTATVGLHKRDDLREPIKSPTDWKLQKLNEFQTMFQTMLVIRNCGVSSETLNACVLMCSSLREIAFSLFNDHDYRFILLGHAQSDPLEQRFGRLRQMSGANFFIGYKQLIESERRIKIVSLLKHTGLNVRDLNVVTDVVDDSILDSENVNVLHSYIDSYSPDDVELEHNELNLLYFISGYIAKVLSVKCENCNNLLLTPNSILPDVEFDDTVTEFLRNVSRGSLRKPTVYLFSVVSIAYKCFAALKDSPEMFSILLKTVNSRACFQEICCAYLLKCEIVSISDTCMSDHSFIPIVRRSVGHLFNIMSKKLVREQGSSNPSSETKIKKLRSTK